VHVLDIIRKKKIYGFYESFIVYILNRQFLIVIQCFFSCIFVRLDFLVHNLDFFNFMHWTDGRRVLKRDETAGRPASGGVIKKRYHSSLDGRERELD
jgi:hypothetical protein